MKRIKICFCMLSVLMMLGGCGGRIPDMTDTEREAISEYAVGLLLKYNTNDSGRLVDLSLVEEDAEVEEPTPTVAPQATPEPTEEPEENAMKPTEDTPVVSVENEMPQQEYYALESVLSLPADVSIQYKDYQITETYTDTKNTKLTLDAEAGNKLIVVRFVLINSGSTKQTVDLLHDNIKYDVLVDEKVVDGMMTLLGNDLITYTGELKPDESCEVVLLAEAEETLLQTANHIYMEIGCEETISKIELK